MEVGEGVKYEKILKRKMVKHPVYKYESVYSELIL